VRPSRSLGRPHGATVALVNGLVLRDVRFIRRSV
jgi:hypothetical protein